MQDVIPIYRCRRSGAIVQTEISQLWALIERVPSQTESGEDPQEAIEAQLSVLSEGLTRAEVITEFDETTTETYVIRAAVKASEWLQGDGEVPSAEWLRIFGDDAAIYVAT